MPFPRILPCVLAARSRRKSKPCMSAAWRGWLRNRAMQETGRAAMMVLASMASASWLFSRAVKIQTLAVMHRTSAGRCVRSSAARMQRAATSRTACIITALRCSRFRRLMARWTSPCCGRAASRCAQSGRRWNWRSAVPAPHRKQTAGADGGTCRTRLTRTLR